MKIKEFLISIDGLSENTKKAYEQSLWQLYERIKGDEPNADDIQVFLKKYKASTLQRHKAAIKAYWEYRFPDVVWPFNRRNFAQRRTRVPRYLPAEAVYRIIELGETEDEKMFVETIFQLGCRITELRSIEYINIIPAGVRIIGKGGNEYLISTTKEFNAKFREHAAGKEGKVFPHSYTFYDKLIKRLGEEAGYPGISCHWFRHARAVDLLSKGMTLSEVQQFLHHASIQTTAVYLEITGGALSSVLEKVESNGNAR